MTRGIASLGMYDHPAQHAANDRLWSEIARRLDARGVCAPERLERSRSVEAIWRAPDLLFAQTCGYPLVSDPELALRVIGVPVYDAPGCGGGAHVSHIVVRDDDPAVTLDGFRGRRAAINAPGSNSGYNLFRATVAPLARDGRFFGAVIETGSHRGSVDAVRAGRADIAAIDAVTFAALCRYEPEATAGLRILANTAPSPTLPFVTARSTDGATVAALRIALAEAVGDPALAEVRAALFLAGVLPGGADRYDRVLALESDAVAAGYPVLR